MKIFSAKLALKLILGLVILGPSLLASAQRGPKDCEPDAPLPAKTTEADEFRFLAVGDTGRGCDPNDSKKNGQCVVADTMLKLRTLGDFGLIFLLGDNVYTTGKPENFPARLYRPYADLVEAGVLLRGALGNHDAKNEKGWRIQAALFQKNRAAQRADFSNNSTSDPGGNPLGYYTYKGDNNDLVEFFVIDSTMIAEQKCFPKIWKCLSFERRKKYTDADRSQQLNYFKGELVASKAKWKVLLLHHPYFSSAAGHGITKQNGKPGSDMKSVRNFIDELKLELAKQPGNVKIDLILAGHDHTYEHIISTDGIQHFVAGAGSRLREKDFDTGGNAPDFRGCHESRANSFMLFSVKRDKINYWAIKPSLRPHYYNEPKVFDSGEIRK